MGTNLGVLGFVVTAVVGFVVTADAKKFDVSASAMCLSVVAGIEPGTLDCDLAQETCSTVEVPWTEPVFPGSQICKTCTRRPQGYKSYCREAFDPVHKATVKD